MIFAFRNSTQSVKQCKTLGPQPQNGFNPSFNPFFRAGARGWTETSSPEAKSRSRVFWREPGIGPTLTPASLGAWGPGLQIPLWIPQKQSNRNRIGLEFHLFNWGRFVHPQISTVARFQKKFRKANTPPRSSIQIGAMFLKARLGEWGISGSEVTSASGHDFALPGRLDRRFACGAAHAQAGECHAERQRLGEAPVRLASFEGATFW